MRLLRRLLRRIRRQPEARRAESDARNAAREYWKREVSEEKKRRGKAEPGRDSRYERD